MRYKMPLKYSELSIFRTKIRKLYSFVQLNRKKIDLPYRKFLPQCVRITESSLYINRSFSVLWLKNQLSIPINQIKLC